jgi:hypothetical protein
MIALTEEITYWEPGANDGTGGITWNAGITVPARVSDKVMVTVGQDGKNISTRYAIYTEAEIKPKSMIFVGNASGQASPTADARMIVELSAVTSMTSLRRYLI